jgi:hypothetical protein
MSGTLKSRPGSAARRHAGDRDGLAIDIDDCCRRIGIGAERFART